MHEFTLQFLTDLRRDLIEIYEMNRWRVSKCISQTKDKRRIEEQQRQFRFFQNEVPSWQCYKTISSCCSCAYVEILSTWEVWRALKRLEHSLFVICDWWISIRFVSFGVSSSLLVILLWPKPDVNIPNIFWEISSLDFRLPNFDEVKYWRFRLTFEIVKVR